MSNVITRAKDKAEDEIKAIIENSTYPQQVLAEVRLEQDRLEQITRYRSLHSKYTKISKKGEQIVPLHHHYKGVTAVEAQAQLEVYTETAQQLEDALIEKGEPLDVDDVYQLKGYPKGVGMEQRDIEQAKTGTRQVGMGVINYIHSHRSNKSQLQDNSRQAIEIVGKDRYHLWVKSPNRYDISGVDTKNGKPSKRKTAKKSTPRMSSIR